MKITIDLSVRHMPIVEQVVLVTTLQVLEDYGWRVTDVHDGELTEQVSSIAEAIEALAGVDDVLTVGVEHHDGRESWIAYIPGNNLDAIHDYGSYIQEPLAVADDTVRGD